MMNTYCGCALLVLISFTLLSSAIAAPNPFTIEYAPPGSLEIVGAIYSDATSAPIVEKVVGYGSYLYLSVRYLNGDQKLEVWNIREPSHPVLTQSLPFGNLYSSPQDVYKFPSVNVFNDAILIRSNLLDYIYCHDATGTLVQKGVFDFATQVGEIKNKEVSFIMSSAAGYGTFFGRLFNPGEVLPEEEYGYIILNFTNPLRPFVATTVPPLNPSQMMSQFAGHLNGALGNNPFVLSVAEKNLRLSGRTIQSSRFVDVFWKPKLTRIFKQETLSRTLKSQMERIIQKPAVAQRFTVAVDKFFSDLKVKPEETIQDVLRNKYDAQVKLDKVLQDYQIRWDDSVRVAVKKVIVKNLSLDLEKELSVQLFAPFLKDWTEELFQVSSNSTPEEIKTSITSILNEGLSPEMVGRFFLDHYIAPLAQEADAGWMFWTLKDLVDRVVQSPAGEAVSTVIGGAHTIADGPGFLELALSFVPEGKQFFLPAGFPENARDVLEYALYEHGAKLNPDGLAFMELLKLYQYYNGNSDYLKYEIPMSDAMRQIQEQLSGAMTDTVEPFLSSLSFVGDMQKRMESFALELPCRDAIALAITDAVLDRLQAKGVNVDHTVHEELIRYHLYLDLSDGNLLTDNDLARVENLIRVLQTDITEAETRIQDLWNEGKSYSDRLEAAGFAALREMLTKAWGAVDLDQTLQSAMSGFLENHVDMRWTFGENMDALLNKYITSSLEEYPVFLDFLDLLKRANDGDVIARWQITFQLAKIAASSSEPTLPLAGVYEGVELALQESYKKALTGAVKMLLNQLAGIMLNQMYGSFSAWVSRTAPLDYSLSISDLTSLNAVRTEAFSWKNKVGLITREEWDFINPRRVALVLFDPTSPAATKQEALFKDGWLNVDYVHTCEGIVMIGGDVPIRSFPTPTAMFIGLNEDKAYAYSVQSPYLSSAEGMLLANRGMNLVLFGPGGVYILPNPFPFASRPRPSTRVNSWGRY